MDKDICSEDIIKVLELLKDEIEEVDNDIIRFMRFLRKKVMDLAI